MRPFTVLTPCLIVFLAGAGATAAQTFGTSVFAPTGSSDEHRVVGADTSPDGGYYLAFQSDRGASEPPDDFSVVVRLDEVGAVLWERRIAGDDPGGPIDAIAAAADGTLFVAGRVAGRRGDSDAWVARLDEQGDILWQRALGGPWYEAATAIRATSDGGAIVIGDAETRGNKGREILAAKLSWRGETEWVRYLGTHEPEFAGGVRETDGGYFVVGSQGDAGFALRLFNDGRVDWARRSATDGFESLALSNSGDGFATVTRSNRLALVSDRGELIRQRVFTRLDSFFEIAESDTGFVLAGTTQWWWAAGVTDTGDLIWAHDIVLPGPPFFGEVRAIVGVPGGGSFTVAEMRSPDFTLALRLNDEGLTCFFGFPNPWTHDFSEDEAGELTPVSVLSRQANGLKVRDTGYASRAASPLWVDAGVCPI